MAKIKTVKLDAVPEYINVGDKVTDIIIQSTIEFHKLDIKLEMEYKLVLFVYDVNGDSDIPVIIGNWDDTRIYGVLQDRKDQFLGKVLVDVKAENESLNLKTPLGLKLGKLTEKNSYISRNLEVFATLIPAIGRASKWSEPFETEIVF